MPMDRLSALDETFIRIESDVAHMHVGWTLLIDGEPPALEELRAHVEARLDLMPRFRRRVLASPLFLHDPLWVDDRGFEIANHVGAVHFERPASPAQLRARVGRLLSRRLDRRRPLWRLYLLDGLRDGGFAIVGQAHHALVDGIAAVEVASLLLDATPDHAAALGSGWAAEPEPSLAARAVTSARGRIRLARTAGSLLARALTDREVLADGLGALKELGTALESVATPAPSTAINRRIGGQRAVASSSLPLADVRAIGSRHGATVNDVVLAISALALGRHLRREGECHPWLRTLVPVSTRATGAGSALGNRLSFVLVDLPIGERAPEKALGEVGRQMQEHKRRGDARALDGLLRAAGLAPVPVRDAIALIATRPQTFNLVVSNVPGPGGPMYLMGRRVAAAYPSVPLAQGHALSVGVLSYDGSLHVGLYTDPTVVPDVERLAVDFASAFDQLRRALGPEPPPSPSGRPPTRQPELVGVPG